MTISSGVSGVLCTLSIEGSLLAESQTFNLTLNQAIIDLTNRDTSFWQNSIAGRRDWAVDGDGLYISGDLAKKYLQYHYTNRSPATLTVILTLADGTITMTGEAILTNLTFPAPHEDAATITFSLSGTDALTPSAS